MILVIVLESGEGNRQRPGLAKWPQAHVHPEYETVGGRFGQGFNEALAEAAEKFFVADGFGPVGLAVARVGKDQVNVRGEVEFAPAQLAHAEYDQMLRLAFGVTRRPETPNLPVMQPIQRRVDRAIRHIGQIG